MRLKKGVVAFLFLLVCSVPNPLSAVGHLISVTNTSSSASLGATNVEVTFAVKTATLLPQGGFIEIQLPSAVDNEPDSTTITYVGSSPEVSGLSFAPKGDNPSLNSIVQNGIHLKTSGSDIPANTTVTFRIGGLTNSSSPAVDSAGIRTLSTIGGDVIDGDANNSSANYFYQTHLRVGDISFQGTVTNVGASAVSQAYVNIYPVGFSVGGSMPTGCITDSAGKYYITTSAVSVGSSYSLEVFPPFQGGGNLISPDRYTAAYTGSPQDKDFQFSTATKTVSGRVTYSDDGLGVSGVNINAFKMNGSGFAQTTTDSNGDYSLLVGGGDWGIMPQPAGVVNWSYGQPPTNLKFTSDLTLESKTVNFSVYKATATITGRLLKPNGTPVAQSDQLGIGVFSQEGKGSGTSIQNDQGTFSIAVPPGTYNINVWAPPSSAYGTPKLNPITVADNETKSVGDITLTNKDSLITGTVKNASGVGIANIRVNAFVRDGGGFSEATSDSNGAFSLSVTAGNWMVMPQLNPSDPYANVNPPQEVSVSASSPVTVNLTLSIASSTIAGMLVDGNGNPVSAYGWAFAESGEGEMFGPGGLGGSIERGNFSFKVPAGTYVVKAGLAPGSSYTSSQGTTITITEGETKNITVPLVANDAIITGSIVDESGNPVSTNQLFVFAVSGSMSNHAFQQGTVNGSSYSVNVAAGEWTLGFHVDPSSNYMSSPPDPSNKFTVTSGGTATKNIVLRTANATISGRVLKPDGSAATGVFVGADSRETQNSKFFNGSPTDSNGNYSIKLTSGTYKVRVDVPPGQGFLSPPEQEVVVGASQTQTANFTLSQSDATISGNVTLNGSPTKAFVYAWAEDGSFASSPTSSGAFSLSVKKGTTWHVGARYENGTNAYESAETTVNLNSSSATVNLSLSSVSYSLPQALTTTFDATKPKIITLTDRTEINIPANALASSGNVTLTVNPKASLPSKKGDKPIWYGYELTATDSNGQSITAFNSSITITFPYADSQLTARGITADDLVPSYYDETTGTWKKVSNVTVNTSTKTVTITVDHFTDFALTANYSSSTSSGNQTVSSSGAVSNTASAPACQDRPPSNAPTLFRIDRSRTSAKLYFAPTNGPVTYYFVSYGDNKPEEKYGVSFDQGESGGVLTYTVNALKPNVTYWFKIRAGNGCMPGPWSNWFSTKNIRYYSSAATKVTVPPVSPKIPPVSPPSANDSLANPTTVPSTPSIQPPSSPPLQPAVTSAPRPSFWQKVKQFFGL